MSSATLNSMPNTLMPQNTSPQDPAPVVPVPEVPKTEAAPSTPPVPPKKDLDSSRLAQFAKREANLVKEREALKKEMEAFKQQQSEIDKYRKAWEMVNEIAELQKVDPVAAMRKAGFKDEEIINYVTAAENQISPEEKAMRLAKAEIDKFKQEQLQAQEAAKKQSEELRKQQEEREIVKFKDDIGKHILSDSEKYEYLNFYGEDAKSLVYEIIAEGMKENDVITVAEAAQLAEEYYEEQDKLLNSLKKRSAGLTSPVQEVKEVPVQQTLPPQKEVSQPTLNSKSFERVEAGEFKTPIKTITNRFTGVTAPTQAYISPEENKARVLQKYAGMLKR